LLNSTNYGSSIIIDLSQAALSTGIPAFATPLAKDLPNPSVCQPVLIDYGLRRFQAVVKVPQGQEAMRQKLRKALESLSGAKDGLVEIVKEP
jgi:hypothetical protein